MEQTTKIYIGSKCEKVIFDKKGVSCKVNEILLSRKGNWYHYNIFKNLRRTQKVAIYKEKFLSRAERILLDDKKLDRLAKYLSKEHLLKLEIVQFDCVNFACHIAGIEYENKNLKKEKCSVVPFSKDNLKVGDVVYIGKFELFDDPNSVNDDTSHFMVYLGYGLFISKIGTANGLIVTELKEYAKIYPFKFINILRPV